MSLILDLLFPKTCYGCGQLGYYFCPRCICRFNLGKLNQLKNSHIEAHLAVFNDQTIKSSITSLKYNFVSHLAPDLARLTASTIKKSFPLIDTYWHQNNFCLIPVPLHQNRLNWRGFNQSSLVGEYLAKFLNLPYIPNLITKNISTSAQVKSTHKSQRLKNLSGAFSLNPAIKTPKNIIIFDDIYTTGATTLSIARLFPISTSIWILSLL